MKEGLISVIIPVYNAEKYIKRCIKSIQANDYKNLEIICINDGSKDRSLESLLDLQSKDKRIRVIDQTNGGVAVARNRGIEEATGEFVSFIDADDYIHSRYYSTLMQIALENKVEMAVCMFKGVSSFEAAAMNAPLQGCNSIQVQPIKEALRRSSCVRFNVTGRLYRYDYIGDKRFPIGAQYGEDTIFNILCCPVDNAQVGISTEQLYFYYQNPESLAHTRRIEENLTLGCWYLDNLEIIQNKSVALLASISALLTLRYEASFIKDRKKTLVRAAQKNLFKCLGLIYTLHFSVAERIKYTLLISSFLIYKICLRLTDPSKKQYDETIRKNAEIATIVH